MPLRYEMNLLDGPWRVGWVDKEVIPSKVALFPVKGAAFHLPTLDQAIGSGELIQGNKCLTKNGVSAGTEIF